MINVTDEELLALVAQNESWALAELYDRYARLVFSLALHIRHDRPAAEETVQEVFTKVWRGAGAFSAQRGSFSSWLVGITRHQCIDDLRRRQARPSSTSIEAAPFEKLTSEDDPAAEADLAFERERIRRALTEIPKEQRLVIELAFFEGLTHNEIAERCAEPLGTVKTRMRLGLQKLRELLKE